MRGLHFKLNYWVYNTSFTNKFHQFYQHAKKQVQNKLKNLLFFTNTSIKICHTYSMKNWLSFEDEGARKMSFLLALPCQLLLSTLTRYQSHLNLKIMRLLLWFNINVIILWKKMYHLSWSIIANIVKRLEGCTVMKCYKNVCNYYCYY